MHASCNVRHFQHVGSTWLTRVPVLHHQPLSITFLAPSFAHSHSFGIPQRRAVRPLRYSALAIGPPTLGRMLTTYGVRSTTYALMPMMPTCTPYQREYFRLPG